MEDETASLLLLISAIAAASPAAACGTSFPNQTVLVYNNLQITLATDRSGYAIGDSVHIFLCVENIGSEPFTTHCTSGPPDRYWMLPDSCAATGGAACYQAAPFMFSMLRSWSDFWITIQPGASVVFQREWNGLNFLTHQLPNPGMYVLLGGIEDGNGNFVVPLDGARLDIMLSQQSGVPAAGMTWSGVKALNQPQ